MPRGVSKQLHVVDEGPRDAPAILLLHGFASSHHSWSRVAPELTDQFRVIRPDLLGHGRTGGRAADSPAQADAVGLLLEELGVDDVTVVGHSFGADVAAELAARSGPAGRVGKLLIIAQAPDYSEATMPGIGAIMTRRRLSPLFWNTVPRPLFVPLGLVARHRARPGNIAEFAVGGLADLRRLDPRMFRIVLVDRPERLATQPLDGQVAASGLPTLVVLGTADHFYGDRPAPRYRAVGARVEIVEGGWHAMPLQKPEIVAGFIRDFAGGVVPDAEQEGQPGQAPAAVTPGAGR